MKDRNRFMTTVLPSSDAELVAACLAGDREAFAQIVERYQRLLCSLAYSATGRLSESEDLAQEAFVTAWRKLGQLREPEKLRPWLCGILRYTASRSRRRASREPVHLAGELEGDATLDLAAEEEPAAQQAMRAEEERVMWHALAQVPENYREPLVLYYREHRSVEHVAAALELSEDAVKQRLSRGRKLLQERVLRLVEGTLERTTPGPVFTAGVVAAIATLGPPAKAVAAGSAGAAAAKAGTTIKTTALLAWVASLSGVISTFLALRVGLDQARTSKERRATVRIVVVTFGSFVALVAAMLGLFRAAEASPSWAQPAAFLSQVVVVGFALWWPWMFARQLRDGRRLRTTERQRVPEAFADPMDQVGSKAGEYRSRLRLFGIPLLHFRFASPEVDAPPVVGWIAGGDRAIGILFAWGGFSVGLVSVGAVSAGVFTVGAVGFGFVSLGSIALGFLALGAMSIGYHAFGSLSAMGWEGAVSACFALARSFAQGPVALAEHANDAAAQAHFASPHADFFLLLFFVVVSFLAIAPVAVYGAVVRRRLGRRGRRGH